MINKLNGGMIQHSKTMSQRLMMPPPPPRRPRSNVESMFSVSEEKFEESELCCSREPRQDAQFEISDVHNSGNVSATDGTDSCEDPENSIFEDNFESNVRGINTHS